MKWSVRVCLTIFYSLLLGEDLKIIIECGAQNFAARFDGNFFIFVDGQDRTDERWSNSPRDIPSTTSLFLLRTFFLYDSSKVVVRTVIFARGYLGLAVCCIRGLNLQLGFVGHAHYVWDGPMHAWYCRNI